MGEFDYANDVRKYTPSVDAASVAGLIKHLGIALKGKDSALVACSDKSERDRVRDHFLKKKLGLTQADADLDKAIFDICQRMHQDQDKQRVTFYYLLAEKYGKLGMFAS
ncbi:MAG: DUF2853 family protein [Hyphomonadaceae bacterium]|jgi:hypothetical protein|nr:DUF2853 family protein [Hyphomonadaceae bacterium]